MGLIKNTANTVKGAVNSASGGFFGALNGAIHQSMFQEYFTSGVMTNDILMKRAEQVKTDGSANNKSDANVISDGSVIDVQSNQCMIIVENGKIVEACMEAGRFTYSTELAPSFFAGEGKFGERVKNVAKQVWEQAKMGGQRANTQRVYFINTGILDKSILWGVGNVQFQHTEHFATGGAPLAVGVTLKGHGTARVRIERPLDFYELYGAKYVGGDNEAVITLDTLGTFFESSKNKITEAIAMSITELGMRKPVRYNEIMTIDNMKEMREMVNAHMEDTDLGRIGFDFYEFTVGGSGFILNDEDRESIKQLQLNAFQVSNVNMANFAIQSELAKGFREAGKNGGTSGIIGMGMAMGGGMGNLGNMQAQAVPQYNNPQQAQQMQQPQQPNVSSQQNTPQAQVFEQTPENNGWKCTCGNMVDGNFCPQCGTKKPEPVESTTWVCECGKQNEGNFCSNCGAKKVVVKKKLVCDKCGWTSEDLTTRFCPNCGDPVTESDLQ